LRYIIHPRISPFDYAYLAPAGAEPAVCFLAKHHTPARTIERYLFGLGSFGLGVSWVYISIHDFGGADSLSSGLLTCLFFGFGLCFRHWQVIFLYQYCTKTRLISMMVMPVVWLLVEYFRGYLMLNGFPWLQIAYSSWKRLWRVNSQ